MRTLTADDRKDILVGRPLPFSIYAADQKLLLAAGRIVPNEFVREGLIRSGTHAGGEAVEHGERVRAVQVPSDALTALQADYLHIAAREQVGFRMEHDGQVLRSRVIGVSEDGRGLIMSGPVGLEGAPVNLQQGETWTFRALYALAAVRFHARVEHVSTEPFRYFYVSHLTEIERKTVRQAPRALTSLWTARAGEIPRVITDLSVGGARVAMKSTSPLQQGQSLLLNPTFDLAIGKKPVSLDATVLNLYGRSDPKHPQIEFYGVRFEKLHDTDRLVLHAFVQEQLSLELDRVWQVLAITPH